ncbi:putative metal-binding motif-containing protein [Portibacter marinus]|uniref:putative metal-binding motif-containing protein n=1 Tax=Portibacter marinus TaxID=2898660 RepID=UPI001F1E2267|nr:putative metal-binding motif-containing protein [Portibacter marinus]
MKRLFIPLFALLFAISCEKGSLDLLPAEKNSFEMQYKEVPKIDICHFSPDDGTYKILYINLNAWPDHQSHGDVRLDDPDGDGYVPENGCGFTGLNGMGDCDEDSANASEINPGAIEICGDGIDNDCVNGDEECELLPTAIYNGPVGECTEVDVTETVGIPTFIRFCPSPIIEVCLDTRQFGVDNCQYEIIDASLQVEQYGVVEVIDNYLREFPGRICFTTNFVFDETSGPIKATFTSYSIGELICD